MKIKKLETIIGHPTEDVNVRQNKLRSEAFCNTGIGSWFYVKVHTDEGITELGEGGFLHRGHTLKAYIEEIEKRLIGKDPLNIEHIWQDLYRHPYERGGPIIMTTLGAIDIALWDIAGKYFNAPVYKLLGGKCRDKIRVYVSININSEPPEKIAAKARTAVDKGYTAIRFTLADNHENMSLARLIKHNSKYFKTVRKEVGDDVDIAIEVHRRLRLFEAIALAKELEQYNLIFMEDPIMPESINAMAEIASRTNIPIATGENLYTLYQFQELIEKRAAKMMRIDLCLAGGISQAKKIAALAEANFLGVIPHQCWSPVATAAYVNFVASIHNFIILEYTPEDNFPKNQLVDECLEIKDGYLKLPERPGIGIELNDEFVKSMPYTQCEIPTLIRKDGSITDW